MDFQKLLNQSTKKPKSILQIVLSISAVILVVWLFTVSKMEVSGSKNLTRSLPTLAQDSSASVTETLLAGTAGSNEAVNSDSTSISAIQPKVISDQTNSMAKETASESVEKPMFSNAVSTFIVMMVLLAGIWFWSRKKAPQEEIKGDVLELGQHTLGQGAQLKFLEINNEVWVMGITPAGLNLLHRYTKEEWQHNQEEDLTIAALPTNKPKTTDFKEIYNLFGN